MFRKYNFFKSSNSVHFSVVQKIVTFLENDGYNFISLLKKTDSYKSPLNGTYSYSFDFSGISDFRKIIKNESNFFRINSVIIDLSDIRDKDLYLYLKELDSIDKNYMYFILTDDDSISKLKIDNDILLFTVNSKMFGNVYKFDYSLKESRSNNIIELEDFFNIYRRKAKVEKLLKNKK